ncbi:phosphogluconate dehydratase [Falsigemmobacter faecalis]|uniref:Phosphogluconate dehydratase n=1 Tax=Falsigemmobacter faecalis TaxID=2488730 RepID=A0A3P3DKQ7_9RHOB|nr:phosphogluconate dehydratase [Falsigemmobacter faecalis]RRH74751.1 phosphogluconate dehydratase [Falsigemmobacter faecalis]
MTIHSRIAEVTRRIVARSSETRGRYLERLERAAAIGPARAHLDCSNAAHASAGAGPDQAAIAAAAAPNIGIVTAYNDMLSAHRPYEDYPAQIRDYARRAGATAQVAGGVPAMCDGVTQGRAGMELSLMSRDVIALASGVAMSHDCFDAALWLGVCDKIVPGLVMAAASFGHIPAVFVPAGPMTSGLPNDEKAKVRQRFAAGEISRAELMAAEMASYHGSGTCTFYGTANTNQMLMELMGLHLPGAAFVNPGTPLRSALTEAAVARAAAITARGAEFTPAGHVLSEKAFVNGIVGLMATGGSTNLVLHLPAMARTAGILLDISDFADLSEVVPLLARVYPNGLADVNHFHAAGGIAWLVRQLLDAGLLHEDVATVAGRGLSAYAEEPVLREGALSWQSVSGASLNDRILRPVAAPFQPSGGLVALQGNLGRGVMKVSSIPEDRHLIEAPARVFQTQEAVKEAFRAGEFTSDVIIAVRFQGPRANGMPELHGLTPVLSVLQARGLRVALLTDGRMSGASGKVPAAIHLSPEAADGGPLARLRDGDLVRLDAGSGELIVLEPGFAERPVAVADLSANDFGTGRELFAGLRARASGAENGASILW